MTASNGSTRRYHPTKGDDLDGAMKMYDELCLNAEQNYGLGEDLELDSLQNMTYFMDEIKGEYLKTVAKEKSA